MSDQQPRPSLMEVLGKAPVVFWVCPVQAHRRRLVDGIESATVRWRDGVAYCLTEGCEHTSAEVTR